MRWIPEATTDARMLNPFLQPALPPPSPQTYGSKIAGLGLRRHIGDQVASWQVSMQVFKLSHAAGLVAPLPACSTHSIGASAFYEEVEDRWAVKHIHFFRHS